MRDFNFFSSSIKEANSSLRKKLIVAFSILMFIVIIGGIYTLVVKQGDEKEAEIIKLKEYINSPETAQKIIVVREKKKEIDILANYHNAIKAVAFDFENADVITISLLDLIDSATPEGVVISSRMLSPEQYTIDATAEDRVQIAKFYHDLMALDIFIEINIGTVSKTETILDDESLLTEYKFNFDCVLKGGANK